MSGSKQLLTLVQTAQAVGARWREFGDILGMVIDYDQISENTANQNDVECAFDIMYRWRNKHPYATGEIIEYALICLAGLGEPEVPTPKDIPLMNVNYQLLFSDLADKIMGCDFHALGIALDLPYVELGIIRADGPNTHERTYNLFNTWLRRNGSRATSKKLIGALRTAQYNSLADSLEKKCIEG